MTASVVIAIIAVIVALCAMIMASNQSGDTSSDSKSDKPSTEEGRKVCVVRGTAWVDSTQITVYTDDYSD